jgi:hypothetical protein
MNYLFILENGGIASFTPTPETGFSFDINHINSRTKEIGGEATYQVR